MKAQGTLLKVATALAVLCAGTAAIFYLVHLGHRAITDTLPTLLNWDRYDPAFAFLCLVGACAAFLAFIGVVAFSAILLEKKTETQEALTGSPS